MRVRQNGTLESANDNPVAQIEHEKAEDSSQELGQTLVRFETIDLNCTFSVDLAS